jgi:type II secretory pathway pseudopilin PulG
VRAQRAARDEGSTLIETIVALALVMTAMGAMGTFFVNSVLLVAQQRTSQDAAQLADSAMEQVRALKGSSLLTGRGPLKTAAQWAAAPATVTPYLNTMLQVSDPLITDPASTLGDDAAVSTATQTMTVDNTQFSRTIYVGSCDIYLGGTSDCVNSAVVTPPADSTKDLEFFRVVVLIAWTARNCPTGTCSYVTSSLISRASEPIFDFHRPSPTVATTAATFYKGTLTSFQLQANGGQLPNTWTAVPVPPGMTVAPNGVVSGTPTTLGTTASSATVTDKLLRSDTEPVTFTVVAPLALTTPSTTVAHVGDTISQAATGSGGVAPLTYKATTGLPTGLPTGLAISSSTGAITGTVTTAGTYSPSITVTDSNGTFDNPASVSGTYSFTVWPAVTLAAIGDQTISLGSAVSVTASGAGGDGRLTYSATGLPLGVTINSSSGVIAGLPTVPGRYLPLVTVTDGSSGSASVRFALIVNTATQLIFTSPSYAAADRTSAVGTTVSMTLANNAAVLGLSPTMTISGLPPGLTLNPLTGTVSGRPTTAGTYTVTALATNVLPPQVSTLTFLWTVS